MDERQRGPDEDKRVAELAAILATGVARWHQHHQQQQPHQQLAQTDDEGDEDPSMNGSEKHADQQEK